MSKLDGINLYCDVTEDALNAWKALEDKFPSVGDFNKTPEKLIAMSGENADVIGALYKNSIGTSAYICRNSNAIMECVKEINHVGNVAVLGLIVGGGALLFGGYIFGRLKGVEKMLVESKIDILELKVKVDKLEKKL